MTAYRKLNDIMKAENSIIQIKQEINWSEIVSILKREPYRKYVYWFVHSKIIPEIGQVSPILTHSGQGIIM